jgi:hypothetical protein
MYQISLIHPSVEGHLGCFQSVAVVNSTAIKMGVQVTLSYPGAHSFRYMPRSGIAGLYGASVSSFLRELHIALHSCTNHNVLSLLCIPSVLTTICLGEVLSCSCPKSLLCMNHYLFLQIGPVFYVCS